MSEGSHDPSLLGAAWGVTLDEFLGPSAVGEAFGLDGRDEDYELVFDWDPADRDLWRSADGSYGVRALEDFEPPTVILRTGQETVGFYMGGQLWVDPVHRGKGMAREMVLACIAWHGALPFEREEGMGYTLGGYEAHASAHAKAVEMAVEAGLHVPDEVMDEAGLAPRPR